MNEHIKHYIQALQGITAAEWKKLSYVINGSFEQQKNELEKELQLASAEDVEQLIP